MVIASSAAFFACSMKFTRTASEKCCKAMATRFRVGPFSSRIQLSPLPCRPRLPNKGSMGEATMRVNSLAPVS